MREQEDKMVQVSLPWNNISTISTPRSVPVSPTAPEHFSTEQINKLESRFSHQKWPDKTAVIIIAMESNLLSTDVEVWFQARREKWIQGVMAAIAAAKDSLLENQ
ncbi:hypothetical protein ACROYT_G020551 [Oculina patagonica]